MSIRVRVLAIAAATILVATLLGGCAGSGSSTSGQHAGHDSGQDSDHGSTEDSTKGAAVFDVGAPDRAVTGPQGAVAQFVVECPFSHAAPDDPIVHPGQPGRSHLHDFFGNTTTNAYSTLASLDAGGTTCEQQLDRAAYWAPALLLDGKALVPVKSTAYYRPGHLVDPTSVRPYPPGLAMVAGNVAATSAQPVEVVAWTCGTSGARLAAPPACPAGRDLRVLVTFPDCWNGTTLDSADHVSHVVYSSHGHCPAGFPVPVPQLQLTVEYPVSGPTDRLGLASGGLLTGHADFVNSWDPAKLATEVQLCLHRGVVCGVTSGRKTG